MTHTIHIAAPPRRPLKPRPEANPAQLAAALLLVLSGSAALLWAAGLGVFAIPAAVVAIVLIAAVGFEDLTP